MFTGIVREVGRLTQMAHRENTARIRVAAPRTCAETEIGDSLCVNGVCLTVDGLEGDTFLADLSGETLARTTFGSARVNDLLNIEPSLRLQDKMGGHIVTGHVDGLGRIESLTRRGEFSRLVVRIPDPLLRFVAVKGAIAVDGISLTVAALRGDEVEIALIPHTMRNTNLAARRAGDPVNIEVDILARYVERILAVGEGKRDSGLTLDKLRQYGYVV